MENAHLPFDRLTVLSELKDSRPWIPASAGMTKGANSGSLDRTIGFFFD
jgi:hypothetical protein